MKLNGREIKGANYEYLVIPRPYGDLVFRANAVLDMKPFFDACPRPQPGKIMLPGGVMKENFDDEVYRSAVAQFEEKRYAFMVLTSLQATEGLEWETVKLSDPSTWLNWRQELQDAGFTVTEVNLIQLAVANANSLNQEKLDEARSRFLASLQAASES